MCPFSSRRRLATSNSTECGTHASTTPNFLAFLARNCLPVKMRSSAGSKPIKRGKRCVPPEPGSKPNITSGKPRRVTSSSVQTR
ncbi:Uncharacterised protein [Vibrio cholerae]|nr:Uncharacterised protein [Vibrio cholerae]